MVMVMVVVMVVMMVIVMVMVLVGGSKLMVDGWWLEEGAWLLGLLLVSDLLVLGGRWFVVDCLVAWLRCGWLLVGAWWLVVGSWFVVCGAAAVLLMCCCCGAAVVL